MYILCCVVHQRGWSVSTVVLLASQGELAVRSSGIHPIVHSSIIACHL